MTRKELTTYEKNYVCFLIAFSRLCIDYPKLLYACCSTYELKKYFSQIKKTLQAEVEFWRK